jgi:prepilin-type processing-associated H-X9-DG protein
MGDPDQGVGPQQPGSWIYSMGRYMDVDANFDIGTGLPFPLKKAALPALMSTAIREFHCPSRRPAVALPAYSADGRPCDGGIFPKNSNLPAKVAKSDYAINGGNGSGWDSGAGGTGGAPSESCLRPNGLSGGPNYPHCDWHISSSESPEYWQYFNGVSGWRIGAQVRQISDGLSKTVLVGEKFVQPMFYEGSCSATGSNPSKGNFGDNGSMYIGWDVDIARTGQLKRDQNLQPPDSVFPSQFGGPHANAANFAFCDGSVRSIRYDVADFARFITRNDAQSPQH